MGQLLFISTREDLLLLPLLLQVDTNQPTDITAAASQAAQDHENPCHPRLDEDQQPRYFGVDQGLREVIQELREAIIPNRFWIP